MKEGRQAGRKRERKVRLEEKTERKKNGNEEKRGRSPEEMNKVRKNKIQKEGFVLF